MTHRMKYAAVAALLLIAVPMSAQTKDAPKTKSSAEIIESLFPTLGAANPADRHSAVKQLETLCFQAGAPGNEEKRVEVCKLLVAKLDGKTPEFAKAAILNHLAFLGRAETVD